MFDLMSDATTIRPLQSITVEVEAIDLEDLMVRWLSELLYRYDIERFVKVEPPSDVDIAKVVATISQRVIRKLRKLGYLEPGIDAPIATGYDPLADDEPELARSMAASVQQRIAFGE